MTKRAILLFLAIMLVVSSTIPSDYSEFVLDFLSNPYSNVENESAKEVHILGSDPPTSGDWTISDTTIVEDKKYIINGSIIIQAGGVLMLKNASIYMNLASDGQFWIEVNQGGNLTLVGSNSTAYDLNYQITSFQKSIPYLKKDCYPLFSSTLLPSDNIQDRYLNRCCFCHILERLLIIWLE